MPSLDASAIYAIQRWLEYENTPAMRVALHASSLMAAGGHPEFTTSTFETVTLERGVFKCYQWMVEFAARQDNHLPVMYGQPMTLQEYHEKKGGLL